MNLIDGLKSDWIYINGFRRIIGAVGKFDPEAAYTLADAIEDAVDDHPERVFIAFEGQEITYADFEARANRFAHWGLSAGLKKGDTVALFMENHPALSPIPTLRRPPTDRSSLWHSTCPTKTSPIADVKVK